MFGDLRLSRFLQNGEVGDVGFRVLSLSLSLSLSWGSSLWGHLPSLDLAPLSRN